ncbi:MAG: nicotinate (nicotinamide) nucleotide adenylyltransferase [Christensenellales bacterium]
MKTALFGGTFNPVHDGHMQMAEYLLSHGYDRVVLAPSNNPAYKQCDNNFDTRCEMLKIAIQGREGMQICDLERDRPKDNYSYITIPLYKERIGEFDFVIGGDSLIDLGKWKNPYQIIGQVKLVVFDRGDRIAEVEEASKFWREQGADIALEKFVPKDISSTIVRLESRLGLVRGVPKGVAEYIEKNGLYVDKSIRIGKKLTVSLADKLKEWTGERTYKHCLRVAYCALKLNSDLKLGLDTDKIVTAGLLHDCAKRVKNVDNQAIPKDSVGTPVYHQFAGSVVAREEFGIHDEDVLNAIKYHTTAKPNMTNLDKLIFCADMLEEDRDFEGVDELRKIIWQDLHQGFVACMEHQYAYLVGRGGDIYTLTTRAVEYYRNENKQQ